jgi:hypothetical protein
MALPYVDPSLITPSYATGLGMSSPVRLTWSLLIAWSWLPIACLIHAGLSSYLKIVQLRKLLRVLVLIAEKKTVDYLESLRTYR